jgi:hypothetical protein
MREGAAAHKVVERSTHRKALRRSLDRVSKAIAQWRRIALNGLLPVEERRRLRHPPLRPDACEDLRRMLLEELARLDAALVEEHARRVCG